MTREELISALESAESGSRALSDEVLLACGWTYKPEDIARAWGSPDGRWFGYHKRPSPAESVDDALGLVPEGWRVHQAQESDNGRWTFWLAERFGRGGSCNAWKGGATPALALSAAILRALPHQDTTESK